jgi:glycosyltransferase involved in cell wall biosynthesis
MNLLILQNTIYEYRVPLFKGIGQLPNVNLRVLYCDPSLLDKSFPFEAKYVEAKELLGVTLQPTLLREIKQLNADVILVMFNVRYLSMMRLLFNQNLREKTAILLWGHGFGKHGFINFFRIYLVKKSDGLVLYYRQQIEGFINRGLDESRLFSAENTIEVSNYGYDVESERCSLLFVGRLQERKKIDLVIQSLSEITSDYPHIQLEIVGDGPAESSLKELANKLLPEDKVVFHGKVVDEGSLKKLFNRSLAYVSPGAIGLGALHAFAYGCPIITTEDDPEHGPEFLNLEEGVNALFAKADVGSLSKVLHFLLSNEEYAAKMRNNAANYYKKHRTMSNMIDHLMVAVNAVTPK